VDSGQVAEAAYQQEIEALLEVLFRLVNPEEQADPENFAGGKDRLLACLRLFKQGAQRFPQENLELFRSNIMFTSYRLKQL
jgi:hypothetical protein